jgi:hypothetical protein
MLTNITNVRYGTIYGVTISGNVRSLHGKRPRTAAERRNALMTTLMLVLLAGGLAAAASGWFLRSRRIRAEHWLWKKKRLRRARLLATSGSLVSVLSGAMLVLGSMG